MIDLLKKNLCVFVLTALPYLLLAQKAKRIQFRFSKSNIVGSYAVKHDSKYFASAIFINSIDFKIKQSKGVLFFSFLPGGFAPIKYSCRIDTLNQENVVKLIIEEKIIELDEVIISSKRNRFSKNGDTISVAIDDIKTKPHAEASELFDRIEGFENNDNGTFRVFGRNVDVVMIDGKRIFGGNPALTLMNINADMIKSIDIIGINGNQKKVINLRLKPDRKSGAYGTVGLGVGTENAYDLSFKANKLIKMGIFSSFGTANSISLFKVKLLKDNEMIEDFYAKNTFFGYQNNFESLQNLAEDDEINAGLFRDNTIGTSFSLEKNNTSQSLNVYENQSTQNYLSNISGITTTEKSQIESRSLSNGQNSRFASSISYGINKKFGKKNTFIFKVESKINANKLIQTDSIYFNDGIDENSQFLNTSRKNNSNLLKIDLGTTIKHKNERVKTLIYTKTWVDFQDNSNAISRINNVVRQQSNNTNLVAELVQSYPITKKMLIEHRLLASSNGSKFENRFLSTTINQTTQNLFRLDNWLYYQQGRALINANLAIFSSHIIDKKQVQNSKNAIRLRKTNIKFPKSDLLSNFNFSYENDLIMPQNLERIGISDSLNFYFRQIGSKDLRPFFSRKVDISYSNINLGLVNLISNLGWQTQNSSIQNNSYFAENTLFVNSRTNIEKTLNSLNGNIFIGFRKLPPKVDINLNYIFSEGQAYNIFNDQPITGRSSFHILNLQTVIREKKGFSLKNTFVGTYTAFQNINTKTFEHTLKLNFNIRDEVFAKFSYKSIFGTSIPFQPVLNFEVQKFIAKNKIGVELKAVNVLNIKNNLKINQNTNQQFITQNNNIPRIILLKFSFYPEKWKLGR